MRLGMPLVMLVLFAAVLCTALDTRSLLAADEEAPLPLTEEERAFLDQHPVLRMGVGVAFPPFQYVEQGTTGSIFRGMVSDYTALLEKRLGVRMVPVYGLSFQQALSMGRSKDIDLFPCISRTPERESFLHFTEPYLSYPLVIITRTDVPFVSRLEDLQGMRVAVIKHLATYSKFVNDYPDRKLEFHFETTFADVLKAVSLGQADACIGNLAVSSYLINTLGLSNLRVAAPSPWEENKLSMAVRDDWPIMAGILQKALDSISWRDRQAIAERWVSLTIAPLADPRRVWTVALQIGGVALVVIGMFLFWNRSLRREVLRRKQAQAKLAVSERKYRQIIESTDTAFFVADVTTRQLVDANTLCLEMAGLKSLDEAVGRDIMSWVLPEQLEDCAQALQQCLRDGVIRDFQTTMIMPDHSIRMVEINASIVLDDAGAPQLHALLRDVTQRKKTEEALIQSEKMRSVGGLAAGMAHEINNPLAAITAGLQNAQRRLDPTRADNQEVAAELGVSMENVLAYLNTRGVSRMLEDARVGSVRAARIVRNMLEFSRTNSVGFEQCALNDLLEDALSLAATDFELTRRFDFSRIRIERRFDHDLPGVPCRKNEIGQVALNLLRNAVQASFQRAEREPDGFQPVILLTTWREGDNACFSIRDNGDGLAPSRSQRVFEPFYTTKDGGEGTGLGLSVSYFIVTRNHGGQIQVETENSQGTTFTVRLPLTQHSKA